MTDSPSDTDSEPTDSVDVDADTDLDADAPVDANSSADGDGDSAVADSDDEIDRRRLIRWIALLAFSVPVVVEALTFGNIIGDEFLGGGEDSTASATDTPTDGDRAVGVGDELLPDTAASETVTASEVRQDDAGDRTYVLRVDVENGTDAPVELRTRALRLRDGGTVDGVSSTGEVPPGESREVTAAWSIPSDGMPAAVEAISIRGDETVVSKFVALQRPAIVG